MKGDSLQYGGLILGDGESYYRVYLPKNRILKSEGRESDSDILDLEKGRRKEGVKRLLGGDPFQLKGLDSN